MSDDIYIPDPNRIIRKVSIGDVQAFPAHPGDVSIALSVYANVKHRATETAYVHNSMYLDATDARDLARALIEAADHADAVRIALPEAEAA